MMWFQWLKCCLVATSLLFIGIPVVGDDTEDRDGPPKPQQKDYITTQGIFGLCAVQDGLNVGNVCFELSTEKNVSMAIDDLEYDVVRGMYRFFEGEMSLIAGPKMLEEGFFCTDVEVDVPERADFVMVFVDGHIPTWFICDEFSGSTTGTITLTPNR